MDNLENKIENYVEENPEEAKEVFKGTSLANEAKQITDDPDKRNNEVNNEAVEEFVGLLGKRPNLHGNDKAIDKMQERIDNLNNSKDEDFLGPDEYIDENGEVQTDVNWKPENADEDFAGPDELPSLRNTEVSTIPNNEVAEIPQTDENYISPEIEYSIEETRTPGKPKEIEDDSHIVGINLPKLKFPNTGTTFDAPSTIDVNNTELNKERLSTAGASTPKSVLGNIGTSTLSSSKVTNEENKDENGNIIGSSASKAPTYDKNSPEEISKAITMRNTSHPHEQTNMFTQRGMMNGPKVGSIKSGNVKLPSGEVKKEPSKLNAPKEDFNLISLKDKIIAKSRQWPDATLNTDDFKIKVVDNDKVFINRQLLETAVKNDPQLIKKISNIV